VRGEVAWFENENISRTRVFRKWNARWNCGVVPWISGLVPLEFDGFSDRRKLIAWDNDRLALIAGLS